MSRIVRRAADDPSGSAAVWPGLRGAARDRRAARSDVQVRRARGSVSAAAVSVAGMRFVHTSDWHLGRTLHGVGMLEHQAAYLDHLVELVRAEGVDAVLVAG